MIATIFDIILFFIAVNKYGNGKKDVALIIVVFFATNAFLVNLGNPIIKHTDMGLLTLAVCSLIGWHRNPSFWRIDKQKGAFIIAVFLLFTFAEFVYSLINSVDTLNGIITVLRINLYVLTYFVFRGITLIEIKNGVAKCFKLTIISCLLFIIQYITHIELVKSFVSGIDSGGYRMQVTPSFIYPFFVAALLFIKKYKYRFLSMLILLAVMIISQNRTPILGLVFQILLFFVLSKNIKRNIGVLFLSIILFPVLNSVLEARAQNRDEETISLSEMTSYMETGDYLNLAQTSTFMFRVALIAERTEYLLEHPSKLLMGVGAIDNNSSKVNQFNFMVGTRGINEEGQKIVSQLNSIDTLWGPIIIRYGLIGFAVYLFLILYSAYLFFIKRDEAIMMIAFLTMISGFIQSISEGTFLNYSGLLMISLFLIIHDRNLSKDLYLLLSKQKR